MNVYLIKLIIFIYIEVDSKLAFERIKNRDRFAEQNISFDYLKSLENNILQLLAHLDPTTVTRINGSNTIEEVELDVKKAIKDFHNLIYSNSESFFLITSFFLCNSVSSKGNKNFNGS